MLLSRLGAGIDRRLDLIMPALVLLAALALRLNEPPVVEQLRNLAFDGYQRLKPRPLGEAPVPTAHTYWVATRKDRKLSAVHDRFNRWIRAKLA